MNKKIITFLKENDVFSLSTCDKHCNAWTAPCFYVFDENLQKIIFLSKKNTKHIYQAIKNNNVSGSIIGKDLKISKIQGIQFTGKFKIPCKDKLEYYEKLYLKKFPFAKFSKSEIWLIELKYVKMTDNTLGFGKKIIWKN